MSKNLLLFLTAFERMDCNTVRFTLNIRSIAPYVITYFVLHSVSEEKFFKESEKLCERLDMFLESSNRNFSD